MAQFTYATLAQAQQELANRLYDSTMQQWSPAELTSLIVEALREFNSLSATQRGDFIFPTVASQTFYDLRVVPNTLRSLNVTDTDLIQQIEYSLLEPLTTTYPLAWTGSAQFTIPDILSAIQRRRDEIVGISGCAITRRLLPLTPNASRIVVPDTMIDIRRITYLPQSGFGLPSAVTLWQSDKWGMDSYEVGYTTAASGTPASYLVSTDPTLSFDVDIPPAFPGQWETLGVETGGTLSAAAPSLFGIPDDWTWVIRWGALADLLGRESNAKDPLRAKYAEGRYRQGISLLSKAPALLGLRVANVPIQISSIHAADAYQVGWQAAAPSQPTEGLIAGLNLIGMNPTPNSGPYSILATVVRNAPIPALPGDFLQVPRDAYDVIIDEAQHIAMFKSGGAEFLATLPLHDRFTSLAALYASKLDEMGEFTKVLLGLSQREEDSNPRYSGDLSPAEADS